MSESYAHDAERLLARLCGQSEPDGPPLRVAFVLAHPDDETIGASYLVGRLRDATLIYLTDGAPRNGVEARAAGFATSGAYARARQRELRAMVNTAKIISSRIQILSIPEQEASADLSSVTRDLVRLFRAHSPEVIVTHPYEGGHPDHDAAAFVVQAACALLEKEGAHPPTVIEMTSYHNRGGAFHFGEFLSAGPQFTVEVPLDEAQRQFKERLIACYPSQERILRSASLTTERYRLAPNYDFTLPAHPGQLLYELFSWNMIGTRWRRLAQAALVELGLEGNARPPAFAGAYLPL